MSPKYLQVHRLAFLTITLYTKLCVELMTQPTYGFNFVVLSGEVAVPCTRNPL